MPNINCLLLFQDRLNTVFGSKSFIGSMAVDGMKPTSISTDTGGGVTKVNLQNGGGPTGIYDLRTLHG